MSGSTAGIANSAIALGANVATALYGVSGKNLKIGIISDSFNNNGGAAAQMAAGNLPNVTVVSDLTSGGSDEGQAMIELAYQIAPSATYYFANGFPNPGGTLSGVQTAANAVAALQAAGCNIIIDDVGFSTDEGFYQTGSVLDNAITAAVASGVQYFSAAGNDGTNYYEGGFTPLNVTIPNIGTVVANDFGGGTPYLNVTIAGGSDPKNPPTAVFEFAQPFKSFGTTSAGAQNSLAIYLLDSNGNIVASSTTNDVGGDPTQLLSFANTTTSTSFRLVVVQNGGTVPRGQLFKVLSGGGQMQFSGANVSTGSGNIYGHELLTGQNSVGAVNYANTPAFGVSTVVPTSFSSVGPGTILYDSQGNPITATSANEPEFAAAQGSDTGVAGFAPFNGTSAAAPNAGAVAALVLSANPTISTTQITSILKQSAIPVTTTLDVSGAGLIQARAAVEIGAAAGGDRWTVAAGGDWNDAASWSTGAAPTSAQAASLADNMGAFTGTYTVTVDDGETAGSLSISAPSGSSATLNVTTDGTLAIGPAGATNTAPTATDATSGDLLVAANGVLNVTGGTITETGSLNVNNGTVTVSLGNVTANNYAEDAGQLTVGGGSGAAGLTLTGLGFVQTGGMASVTAMGTLTTTVFSDSAGIFSIAANGTVMDTGTASFTSVATFNDAGSFNDTGAASFLQTTANAGGSFVAGSVSVSQAAFFETGSLSTIGALTFDDTNGSVATGATVRAASLGVGATLTGYMSTVTVSGTVTISGGLSKGSSGAGATIALQTGGELDIGGGTNDAAISFAGNGLLAFTSTNTAVLGNQLLSFISGLGAGNGRIDFTGLTYNALDTLKYNSSNGEVDVYDQTDTNVATVFLDTGTNYTGLLQVQSNGAANNIEVVVACYLRGTSILTAQGERAVEDLQVGDLVVTFAGQGATLKPVRWLGHRRIDLRRHADPENTHPIRFRAGSLGEGCPHRDLIVSPGHRMRVGDVLVTALELVNGATIVQESPDTAEYWHIELDGHDLVLAEGVQAETYQDTGNRHAFENGNVVAISPVLDGDVPEPCLPYAGASAAVRARLIARAEALGWTRSVEPMPWLDVDGQRVEGNRHGDRYRFNVPAGCSDVRLRSRAGRAWDTDPHSADRRRLGVKLHRLALGDQRRVRTVALAAPGLGGGFNRVESDESGSVWRWTTGDAALPLATLAPGRAITVVEIAYDQAMPMWIEPVTNPADTLRAAAAAEESRVRLA